MLERSVDRLKEVADLLRRIERKQGDIAKGQEYVFQLLHPYYPSFLLTL